MDWLPGRCQFKGQRLKRLKVGSSLAQNTCLSIPSGLGSFLSKCVFEPFWTELAHFQALWGLLGAERVPTGSKQATNACLNTQSV